MGGNRGPIRRATTQGAFAGGSRASATGASGAVPHLSFSLLAQVVIAFQGDAVVVRRVFPGAFERSAGDFGGVLHAGQSNRAVAGFLDLNRFECEHISPVGHDLHLALAYERNVQCVGSFVEFRLEIVAVPFCYAEFGSQLWWDE